MENYSRYPYIDRNPCIVAAGKTIGSPCENIKDIFQDVKFEEIVDVVKRQLQSIDPKAYSSEWTKRPDIDTSGAFTEIRHCLRPPKPTFFQSIDEELKETIYDSYWNKALGRSRDCTPGFPSGFDPNSVTFGKETFKGDTARVLVNPPKKAEEVRAADEYYHDLYAFSHNNHYPGEQVKYGYYPPFNEYNTFGKPTNGDESGARAKRALTWFNNDPISSVSRRQAAVRSRTLPSLGKPLDKTGVTDILPENHTYGKPCSLSFYGVEDLLNECPPSLMRRDMLIFMAYANQIRLKIFKKVSEGEIQLEELYEEIMKLHKPGEDPECSVHFDCIDGVMKKHKINLDKSKLHPLLLILGLLSEDGKIKVRDFISFIDKNSRFPELKRQHYILPPEFQDCKSKHKSDLKSMEEKYRILSMPPAGLPTQEINICYPRCNGIFVDLDHLGLETTARSLISPSMYTQYGLTHRDFFVPRSKEFLGNLFRKIDVDLSDKDVEEIYNEGFHLDQTGGVCVETFRNILDKRAFLVYSKN